jgi:hypothetical protein
MRSVNQAGAALQLLCLPVALSLLASCERQRPQVRTKPSELEERQQLIEAMKHHPSLQPGSNEAGPAIHVDPYPHSAGMSGLPHHDSKTAPQDEPHNTPPQ